MKIILAFLVLAAIGWNTSRYAPSPDPDGSLKLENIQTDRVEVYPSTFCWWCSCWVTEPDWHSPELAKKLTVLGRAL